MIESFTIVIVVVAIVGTALSFTPLLWPFRVAEDLGRVGAWFSHEDELAPEARPDGNVNDAQIHHRELRSRF